MKRKLFFGLALAFALASMYAGIFGLNPWVRYSLVAAACLSALRALLTRDTAG